ncbi:hypothetical protein ABL78_3859 [Leptomonas seymouri]|uniref:Uncharacterized protein n=1 Tax=Leptomonas seymouri TaxID=5684 RepID=A0A0N0P6E1_LEPSE|nr:hypothetical protein ABL78_3859 [Leptomonas seymouri]|eukprot:KPI87047.1 hypothetical protein ABL78_3859 [Leptomonas seymouri]
MTLRKAVESRFERNAALLAWCEAERAELEGRTVAFAGTAAGIVKTESGATAATHVPPYNGASTVVTVKQEAGVTASRVAGNDNDEDDVLGSFFS